MSKKKIIQNKALEVVFILDESGSMYPLTEDTIGGFNSMVEKQKSVEGHVNVTLVTFNTEVKEIYASKPILEVENLTYETYSPNGITALYDAVGITIGNIESKIKGMPEDERPKIMMVITTDGEENASQEYSQSTLKMMIENKEKEGWEIIFIGANIDTATEGGKMGLRGSSTANYQANSKGVARMYTVVSDAVMSVRNEGTLDSEWAKGLDEEDTFEEESFSEKLKKNSHINLSDFNKHPLTPEDK